MESTILITPLGDVVSARDVMRNRTDRTLLPAPQRTAAALAMVGGSVAKPTIITSEAFLGLNLSTVPPGDDVTGIEVPLFDTGNTQGPGPLNDPATKAKLAAIPLIAEYVDLGGALDIGDTSDAKPGVPAGTVSITDSGTGKRITLSLGPPPKGVANLAIRLRFPSDSVQPGEGMVRCAYNGGKHDTVHQVTAMAIHQPAAEAPEEIDPAADGLINLLATMLGVSPAALRALLVSMRG